jgi:DNA-directed RNA polymerase specialized sigma24 family protein
MTAEESFVEYASGRWITLYRVAFLLMADSAAAEDLLRTTLGQASARWPDVIRSGAPEAYVRQLLVREAISGRRRRAARRELARDDLDDMPGHFSPSRREGGVDHAVVWPLVCALPERQRSVVVLRYYEHLSEAESARVLGCAVRTVKALSHDAQRVLRRALGEAPAGHVVAGMSLDQQLSVALAERADRLDAPMPDIGAVLAGGRRRQRRRVQRLVAAIAAVAVVVTAAAGLTWRGSRASGDPDQPAPEIARASDPVWCVTDPDRGEMIVGVGEPVKTPCRFGGEDWHVHLWHHAGTTLLTYRGLHRVDDGHLTYLAAGSEFVRMSHDGRYATWTPGCTTLEVYEVATGTRLAMTRTGATGCLHVEGIDDRGRVYMTVDHDEAVRDLDVRMYDVWASRWTRVVGLPEGAGRFGFLNYVTADGIAVPAEQYVVANSFSVGLSSIEGRVDSGGRFFGVQRVPVGRGLWSPDRTLVVEHRPKVWWCGPRPSWTRRCCSTYPRTSSTETITCSQT